MCNKNATLGVVSKEFEECSTSKDFVNFLEEHGWSHDSYYHCTTLSAIEKILDSGYFFLTQGNSRSLNDQHEWCKKGKKEYWNRLYIGSFSYRKTESVPMWELYGKPHNETIRIELSNNFMNDWIKKLDCYAVNKNKVNTKELLEINKSSLTDIMYIEQNDKEQILCWHDNEDRLHKSIKNIGFDEDPQLTGYEKNIGWDYEYEVRLMVELRKNEDFCGYPSRIAVKIPDDFNDNIKIITGPYFSCHRRLKEMNLQENQYKMSWLEGRVNFR